MSKLIINVHVMNMQVFRQQTEQNNHFLFKSCARFQRSISPVLNDVICYACDVFALTADECCDAEDEKRLQHVVEGNKERSDALIIFGRDVKRNYHSYIDMTCTGQTQTRQNVTICCDRMRVLRANRENVLFRFD